MSNKNSTKTLEEMLVSRIEQSILIDVLQSYLAANKSRIPLLELMTRMNLWLEDTLRLARYMVDTGLAKPEGQDLALTSLEKHTDIKILRKYHWLLKWDINYSGVTQLSEIELKIIDQFKKMIRGRPSNNDKIDQYYCTPETNARRLTLLLQEPLISSKQLCFLGDDDITSLMFAMSGLFGSITVFDIDRRIVNFINQLAREIKNPHYKAILYDYRKPRQEIIQYDIFHSDPPATIEAVDLVLKKASQFGKQGATFYLSWPEYLCDPAYLIDLQKVYGKNGWLVTAKFPEFNQYDNRCFFNYITKRDRETLKLFNLTENDILNSPPMQRYCLTRLLLVTTPRLKVTEFRGEIYLSKLHKIPRSKFRG